MGGTNCDAETRRSFAALGVQAEVAHVNEVVKRRSLREYDVLVFPGGFLMGIMFGLGLSEQSGFWQSWARS